MYNKLFFLGCICMLFSFSLKEQISTTFSYQPSIISGSNNTQTWQTVTSNGYTYRFVKDDPLKTRFYTLDNGLTVILAESHKKPRISCHIAVRSGSNNDPRENTGLAHYLEHMLFKGTQNIGSYNWEKEKPLIDKIEQLYEVYNSETDETKRKEIYKEIDAVSGEASTYSIANEYDKLMNFIGSQGTNAWTWLEETVYTEEIPANTLDLFLEIQAERFKSPVLRLFHTELETVYEEKNQSFTNDFFAVNEPAMDALFPTHNIGQQTTLGSMEHLKNPSLVAIKKFYEENYIPNNMGVIMVGDFDSDEVIAKVDQAFSYMEYKEKNEYIGPKEAPIDGPIEREILTPTPASVNLFYRGAGANTKEAQLATLAASVLYNGSAGLVDINLLMEQKLQDAYTYMSSYKDYSVFQMSAYPQEGQPLEEARDQLLAQIDLLKKGAFDASLIQSIVANQKLQEEKEMVSNDYKIEKLTESFIKHQGKKWNEDLKLFDKLAAITKEELVAFANTFFTDKNYVVVYKRVGKDENRPTVVKPEITPIETNADKTSTYVDNLLKTTFEDVQPVWVAYDKEISKAKVGPANMLYVENRDNALFTLTYNFPFGKWADKKLGMATQYLKFLGTDKLSAEAITQEFYKLACNFSVDVQEKETVITLSGLQQNFQAAVRLFDQLLSASVADEDALTGLKEMTHAQRADAKLDKYSIAEGLYNRAIYGEKNPFKYRLTNEEIDAITSQELLDILRQLPNYEHTITYYGPATIADIQQQLQQSHVLPSIWLPTKQHQVNFEEKATTENKILFADYDALQADISWVRTAEVYDETQQALIDLTNGYFGSSMGSVVFREIREAKALAYSTYSAVSAPAEKGKRLETESYVGTQADKIHEAITTMNTLHNNLPEDEERFEIVKEAAINDIETGRILRSDYISNYLKAQKLGIKWDSRKMNYPKYSTIDFAEMKAYHQSQYANQPFTYLIVGSKEKLDLPSLEQYGTVQELTLEEIFGYGPVEESAMPAAEVPEGEYLIQGKVFGKAMKQITLNYELDGEKKTEKAEVKNGKFSFSGKAPAHPIRASLDFSTEQYIEYFVYLEEGLINVTINTTEGKEDMYGLKGTPSNDLYSKLYNSVRGENTKASTLMTLYYEKESKGEKVDDLEEQINNLFTQVEEKTEAFIGNHLNSVVAAYTIDDNIFSYEAGNRLDSIYQLLGAHVKVSPIGQLLKQKVDTYAKIGIGKPAMEISMPNAEEEVVTLSSQKGKYVLLDFWATWCGPCVKEMPNLVEVYEKYHEKGFEVYAVSLDTKKSAWQKFLKTKKLPWINVSDLQEDNAAGVAYSVNAVPANFLLDKEGTIIGKNMTMEELAEQLEMLLQD